MHALLFISWGPHLILFKQFINQLLIVAATTLLSFHIHLQEGYISIVRACLITSSLIKRMFPIWAQINTKWRRFTRWHWAGPPLLWHHPQKVHIGQGNRAVTTLMGSQLRFHFSIATVEKIVCICKIRIIILKHYPLKNSCKCLKQRLYVYEWTEKLHFPQASSNFIVLLYFA